MKRKWNYGERATVQQTFAFSLAVSETHMFSCVRIFCWYTLIRALPLVYTVYRWACIGSRKLVTPRYAITFLYNIKSDSNFYYSIPVAFSFFFFLIQFNSIDAEGGKKIFIVYSTEAEVVVCYLNRMKMTKETTKLYFVFFLRGRHHYIA